MNKAVKTASSGCSNLYSVPFRAALFHSTPVCEQRRKSYWDSGIGSGSSKRSHNYAKRFRRMEAKRTLLRNVSAYADHLFQSWKSGSDEYDEQSSRSQTWFRSKWTKGKKRYSYNSDDSQWETYQRRSKGAGGFQFCWSDDEEVETVFRTAFGGGRCYYWSFYSSGYSTHKSSSDWRNRTDYEYDSSKDSAGSDSSLASDRLALGLNASGPLKLEEVKNAYRTCALRWHPDRHHGSSKAHPEPHQSALRCLGEVEAEEKFKLCSAAYQSLCDKLALN